MKLKFPALKILYYPDEKQEWKIIILSFTILFLAILAVNIYLFLRTSEEINKPVAETELSSVAFKRDIFEQTLDDLEKKEHYFEQGLMAKPKIPDPSL